MTNDEDPFESYPPAFVSLCKSPRSFPEDYDLENGNYTNRCYYCHELFVGHKLRLVCKKCSTPRKMKFNIFNYFHSAGLAAGFLALAFADVLVKEHRLGQGPIVDSLSIMSPGGKFCATAFLILLVWTFIVLPIRSVILYAKKDRKK